MRWGWLEIIGLVWLSAASTSRWAWAADVVTIAGNGDFSYDGDGGQATSASMRWPTGLAIDSIGNVYVSADSVIRKITVLTGIITTHVGMGTSISFSGDGGVATSATLSPPYGIYIDNSDNLFICDKDNHRIRKVTKSTSIISTIAGTGTSGYSNDNGQATSAKINTPHGVALDSSKNVYFSDTYNQRIRVIVISTGTLYTIVGTGTAGYSGDGGQATSASIFNPVGINLDSSNNIYFSDNDNHVIRKVTVSTGVISTVAGTGSAGYNGDNIQATTATFNNPQDVQLDSYGNLYICDHWNNRLRKVTISTGIITTEVYVGPNRVCFSRFDSDGNLYISSCTGNTVMKVTGLTPTTTPTTAPTILTNNDFEVDLMGDYPYYYMTPTGWVGSSATVLIQSGSIDWLNYGSCASGSYCVGLQGHGQYIHQSFTLPATHYAVVTFYLIGRTGFPFPTPPNLVVSYGSVHVGTFPSTLSWVLQTVTIPATSASRNHALNFTNSWVTDTDDTCIIDLVTVGIQPVTSTPTISATIKSAIAPTFAPSVAHIISFQITMTIAHWPDAYITASSAEAIAGLVTDIIDLAEVQVSFQNITEHSNRRRKLVSYTLPIVITITAMSTLKKSINVDFVDSMNTAALVRALNSACGCDVYSSISVSFISADDYCVDANNPSMQCSFGRIKINPYSSSIANYAFYDTEVSGVDFGECLTLTEIGASAFASTNIEALNILSCDQLTEIGDYAFAGSQIKRMKLPQDLNFKYHVFEDTPLEEIYCEAPYADVNDLQGIGWRHNVLVIGCLGYNSDYFLYPYFSVAPLMETVIIASVATFAVLHALIFARSSKNFSAVYVLVSVLASTDLGSDVFHLLFSMYSTEQLYFASFLFVLIMPIVYFIVAVIVQHSLVPHVLYEWYIGRIISRRCKWNIFWMWLSSERGAPLVNSKRQSFTFNNHDSIPKVFVFISSWVILLGLQAISLIPFFIWVILLAPYYVLVVVVGSFLFHTKLLAHSSVWNVFVILFTGRYNRYSKTSAHDTKLLNDALFAQLILTSLPSLGIKVINYEMNLARNIYDMFSTYKDGMEYGHLSKYWPVVSILISGIFCAVGIYRYVYLVLRYKYLVQHVPFTVQYIVSNNRKSVGVVSTKEDIKYNKEAIVPYRKYWKEKAMRTTLDRSMEAVMEVVSRCFIKDEVLSDALNTLLKLRVSFVQSVLEAKELQMFDEETCTVDVHQLARRVFELLLKDSYDLTMYRVLTDAAVRQPSDLLDINQETVKNILNSLHNRANYGTILAYLNLITYNNFAGRGSGMDVSDDGIENIDGSIIVRCEADDGTGRMYQTSIIDEDVERGADYYATQTNDEVKVIGGATSRLIANNLAARKVKSRIVGRSNTDATIGSSNTDATSNGDNEVVVNDKSIRKVKKSVFFGNRDSAKQYAVVQEQSAHGDYSSNSVGSTYDTLEMVAVDSHDTLPVTFTTTRSHRKVIKNRSWMQLHTATSGNINNIGDDADSNIASHAIKTSADSHDDASDTDEVSWNVQKPTVNKSWY